ncbi:MAG: hypothetical protein KKA41_14195 [Proteobacteria bacterium]|nr:hypothetical protein [Pseudomonadota bacterium]
MKSIRYVYFWKVLRPIIVFAIIILAGHVVPVRAELRLGVDIPTTEPLVGLASVMGNPAEYDGKAIVMKGFVSGQCASLCEFMFRDGMHTATIYPQGFKFPKLKKGKPVTIYTQVISGEGQVVFSALGLKME